ncbi:cytochrome P450 3A30 [Lophium mytilinum]|uniref:Cytochrome P450 3A30 n=1 Tax=Lophium mytilinum TaxID=390894 RepID=A0A6A6QTH6_9PEZI|nr:cytochrome P450 3A30 [Lophium mytilinum]
MIISRFTLQVGLSIFAAWLVYFIAKLVRVRRSYRNLPKPPHSFLWGHLKLMGEMTAMFPSNMHPHAFVTTMSQKYDLPGAFYVDLWPITEPWLVITDPDTAQYTVLKGYPKHRAVADTLAPLVGSGNIAEVNGEEWRVLHRMISPAFNSAHIKNMSAMVSDQVKVFGDKLKKFAASGEVFSLEKQLSQLLFDTTGMTVYNILFHAQTSESAWLKDMKSIQENWVIQRETWNPITKVIHLLKHKAASWRDNRYVEQKIIERLTEIKRDNVELTSRKGLSILDLLLFDRLEELKNSNKSTAEILDKKFMNMMLVNLKAILMGGQGTTTDTLCFIFMLLSIHPAALARLRAEHDVVFSPSATTTHEMIRNTPYKLNDLPYTTGVIKETLRLFPIGFVVRSGDSTGHLPYNGAQLPTADHMICLVHPTMHYNPSIFPSPKEFRPERFLEGAEVQVPRNAYRPFELGPRGCLGRELAIDEMKIVLLLTAREFDFECANVVPNKEPRCGWTDLDTKVGDIAFQELGFEAKPRGGMMMKVSKREA